MQVITDDRGYVLSFAFVGNMVGASETPEPEDMDLFMHQFYAFQLKDGKLMYDPTEYEKVQTEEQKENLRSRRETECFAVINRGQLWYGGAIVRFLKAAEKYSGYDISGIKEQVEDKRLWFKNTYPEFYELEVPQDKPFFQGGVDDE